MKKLLLRLVLISTLFGLINVSAEAQRRSRNTRAQDQREMISEPMQRMQNISLGTLGFGNGISISGKYSYGVQLQRMISTGLYAKAFYDLQNIINAPDISLFSYGGGAFVKLDLFEGFYVKGEFGYSSYDRPNTTRLNKFYPSVGGGIDRRQDNRSYGFHLMVPLNTLVRDVNTVQYWIDFGHYF